MLTIFSCPKPFREHIDTIQRNAIRSWTLLKPRPEIILIGDEEGVSDVCREYGLRHIPALDCNEIGTPLVKSVFDIGRTHAGNRVLAYVNADIILLDDFVSAVSRVTGLLNGRPFLLLGGRWNVKAIDIDFSDLSWQEKAKQFASASGWFDGEIAMDYFIFPKDIDWQLPPFLLGRSSWDSYFCYRAEKMRMPVIDVSQAVTAIHQDHQYTHMKAGADLTMKNREVNYNFRLLGFGKRYTIRDCTHYLVPEGIRPRKHRFLRYVVERLKEVELWMVYYLRDRFHPYSYPLYVVLRQANKCLKVFFGLFHRTRKELC